jgi:3-methyladenine DNA glycosylase AlkD
LYAPGGDGFDVSVTAAQMLRALRVAAKPSRVSILQRFFRTAPGEYSEDDVFIGVTVPAVRLLVRRFRDASLEEIDTLLHSPVHEARLLALLLLIQAFRRGDDRLRQRIYRLYLSRIRFINNWDLVDSSAPQIVGAWLMDRSRAPLSRLARSRSLWQRRIAIIATQHFIRQGDLDTTFAIADMLLDDRHDLIHKAVGWMLREARNKDGDAERRFLASRHQRMPRTMLRYAIEKWPERERRAYLRLRRAPLAPPDTTRRSSSSPGRS